MGGSSQSRPSQVSPSRMIWVCSSVERALSVSSMRSRNLPPSRRAKSQLKSAVRAPPTWRYPVGDGAKRTRAVMHGGGGIRTPDRVLRPYNGLANRRLQPLGHLSNYAGLELSDTREAVEAGALAGRGLWNARRLSTDELPLSTTPHEHIRKPIAPSDR